MEFEEMREEIEETKEIARKINEALREEGRQECAAEIVAMLDEISTKGKFDLRLDTQLSPEIKFGIRAYIDEFSRRLKDQINQQFNPSTPGENNTAP